MTNSIPREKLLGAYVDMARSNFYYFCALLYPRFYRPHRKHLREIANTLQSFYEGKLNKPNLILALPPRHGKSYSVQNFCKWILGKDPTESIITVSYGQALSLRAGKEVRNSIMEKSIGDKLTYSDIFPETKIKAGDGAAEIWAVEGSHFSYLSTSPNGPITGVGTRTLIIDDLIRDAYEAFNERILDELWEWYTNTALSRCEIGARKMVIATRWTTKDLAGRLLAQEPDKWHVIEMPACLDEESGTMLDESILPFTEYLDRKEKTDQQIFAANYQQKPFDSIDRLYTIRTYETLPDIKTVHAYADTADLGSDYLCLIVYGVKDNLAYVLDVIYSQAAMETTEDQAAQTITLHRPGRAFIESNNGGRGWARQVEAKTRAAGHVATVFETFTQSQNKEARILSNASVVSSSVLMPSTWRERWPKFYEDVTKAGRNGKWLHDDAMDALTGVVEKSILKKQIGFLSRGF